MLAEAQSAAPESQFFVVDNAIKAKAYLFPLEVRKYLEYLSPQNYFVVESSVPYCVQKIGDWTALLNSQRLKNEQLTEEDILNKARDIIVLKPPGTTSDTLRVFSDRRKAIRGRLIK